MASELAIYDPQLIWLTIAVIVIPFITGIFLILLRGLEIIKDLNDPQFNTDEERKGHNFSEKLTGSIGVAGLSLSWAISLYILIVYFVKYVTLGGEIENVMAETPMLPMLNTAFTWGVLLDPMSVIFMFALTTISSLIHIYATNYMHRDSGFTRFFGTLNYFTGSMLGFVLASNLFTAFIFWEQLGFSSYLLIGYYWPKKSAAAAGKKAFLYNKIGDVMFLMGIALTYARTHTLDFLTIKEMIHTNEFTYADAALPAVLLFGAAVGKSAQIPLAGWLPEAMEGPTPVSALLHSSTMVKAGLLLIARIFFMYYPVHEGHVIFSGVETFFGTSEFFTPGNIIAWFGTLTALAGGLMALTATDIKKVLAFSTISQLGYIGLAIGSGGLTAGFYHLLTHATFKSLLFLGAGAVIHSVHSQEMDDMGGLRKKMPVTFWTMLIGLLGLSGFPLMSGFWSKDAVLLSLKESEIVVGNIALYWIGVFTAGITAFYSSKLLIKTFLKEPRYDRDHVHPAKAAWQMQFALIGLGAGVVIETIWYTIGTLSKSESALNFEWMLSELLGVHGGEFQWADALPSSTFVILGILFAFAIYYWNIPALVNLLSIKPTEFLAKIVQNRFGMDMFLYWFAESPVMATGNAFASVDEHVIDRFLIDTVITEKIGLGTAELSDNIDNNGIDGFIRLLERISKGTSYKLRAIQSGKTTIYARIIALGVVVILSTFTYITLITTNIL